MAVVYQCRSCHDVLATFYKHDSRIMQSLSALTPDEAAEMVERRGDDLVVWVLCEHCQAAYEAHPELYELESPLQ
ncbi:MAG: DUF2757 family protein [Hydrogenibacillus sp.]|nr:DUF2757 family protein [Hydrogenibacillus sp.]